MPNYILRLFSPPCYCFNCCVTLWLRKGEPVNMQKIYEKMILSPFQKENDLLFFLVFFKKNDLFFCNILI